jgi:hypothetical protein
MDLSDIYINDLLYYNKINQFEITDSLQQTNDIEKNILTKSIRPKIIDLPRKKKKTGTFYMIDREVYFHEYES